MVTSAILIDQTQARHQHAETTFGKRKSDMKQDIPSFLYMSLSWHACRQ